MKNNSILFISYYFSPIKASGSIRNSKLAKYLSLKMWQVYVLSTFNDKLFKKEDILGKYSNNIKKYNIFTVDFQTIKLLLLKLNKFSKKKIIRFNPFENTAEMELCEMFNMFPFNILIGEGGLIYIIHCIFNALFLIKRYRIKTIYTSYSPFSDIFIGYILKLIFPHLIWIADFRDLHIDKFKKNLLMKVSHVIDKKILKKADCLTTVSYGLAKPLKEYNSNVYVIHNGFDADDMNLINIKVKIKDFSFLYVGALYGSRRDPGILFDCIQRLIKNNKSSSKKIKVIYAGREGELFIKIADRYNLRGVCTDLGYINRKKSLKLQRNSCFLIMMTWSDEKSKGILSGKFYEYLSSGRPIICIINGDRDREIENLFKITNAGIVIYTRSSDSQKKLKRYILKHYCKYKKGNFKNNYNKNIINKFSYNYLADDLIALIQKVMRQSFPRTDCVIFQKCRGSIHRTRI